jgi:hypothetical protein
MRNLFAVAMLTIAQFTAFPFFAIVAANTARHAEADRAEQSNVTVVYKSDDGRSFETL